MSAEWRTTKLEYYKEFFDSVAMNVEGDATNDTHREFARASNNLLLVASKAVLSAHHAYRDQIKVSNIDRNRGLDAPLLTDLLRAMRQDVGMPDSDIEQEQVQLWAAARPRNPFSKS